MKSKNVLIIAGTRPEFIKVAPVWLAMQQSESLNPMLLNTGQHAGPHADALLKFFGIVPDISLELARKSPALSHLTALLLESCTAAIEHLKPDCVLVQGDTATAMVGAMAAFYAQIPVGHIEAGLRTGDRYSPFPEEANRCIISKLAEWHYAPTHRAISDLEREGLHSDTILYTGNTGVDATHLALNQVRNSDSRMPADLPALNNLKGKKLVVVTAHRRENWGAGIESIANAVCTLMERHHDLVFLWTLHPNPAIKDTVNGVFERRRPDLSRLMICPPLDYPEMIWALSRAWMTLTDSGGIQEESATVKLPAIVLRESTERPEIIDAGGGILTGSDSDRILNVFTEIYHSPERYQRMQLDKNPFGDGNASQRIIDHLQQALFRTAASPNQLATA